MIEFYSRKLNEKEKVYLKKQTDARIKFIKETQQYLMKYLPLFVLIYLIGTSVFFYLLAIKIDSIILFLSGICFIVGTFLLPMIMLNCVTGKRKIEELITKYNDALEENKVKVIHCQSERMLEFEEFEDEGAEYLFQVETGRIFHLFGQEYYETGKFPNSDFELAAIIGKDGYMVDFYINCLGQKLKPERTISAEKKGKYANALCELPELFDGSIDNIDNILNSK